MKSLFVKVAMAAVVLLAVAGLMACGTGEREGEITPAEAPPSGVTLHRPVPANPLRTPELHPPFSKAGPTAGHYVCTLAECVKVEP